MASSAITSEANEILVTEVASAHLIIESGVIADIGQGGGLYSDSEGWGPWKGADGSASADARAGGWSLSPASYDGNVTVSSITGIAISTMATSATKVRVAVSKVTGIPGALYIAFGANAAAAVANVNATAGSEAGMLISLTPAGGDEYLMTIPSAARDGGSLAAGTAAYDAGNHEIDLNIVQGI